MLYDKDMREPLCEFPEERSEPFDEVLKDGDVFEHCMRNPKKEPGAKEYARFMRLKAEFGLEQAQGKRPKG